jgi:hypothetical protein
MTDTAPTIEIGTVRTLEGIPLSNLPAVLEGVAKWNKRAAKAGLGDAAFSAEVVDTYPVAYSSKGQCYVRANDFAMLDSLVTPVEGGTIAITGPVFIGRGWEMLGVVEFFEGGNIVSGEGLSRDYADAKPTCEHCNRDIDRSKVIVCRNPEGDEVQFGTTCVTSYLGVPTSWLSLFRRFRMTSDEEFGMARGRMADELRPFLAEVAACARVHGHYTSASAAQKYNDKIDDEDYNGAYKVSTVSEVFEARSIRRQNNASQWQRDFAAARRPIEADWATVDAALEAWAQKSDDGSVFFNNMRVVLSGDFIPEKKHGLAAWVIGSYYRDMEKLAEAKTVQKAAKGYLAAVGTRLDIAAQIVFTTSWYGTYGETFLYKMMTDSGHLVTWFASREIETPEGHAATVGCRVDFKATVKKHEVYKGEDQTVVTRGKVHNCTLPEAE